MTSASPSDQNKDPNNNNNNHRMSTAASPAPAAAPAASTTNNNNNKNPNTTATTGSSRRGSAAAGGGGRKSTGTINNNKESSSSPKSDENSNNGEQNNAKNNNNNKQQFLNTNNNTNNNNNSKNNTTSVIVIDSDRSSISPTRGNNNNNNNDQQAKQQQPTATSPQASTSATKNNNTAVVSGGGAAANSTAATATTSTKQLLNPPNTVFNNNVQWCANNNNNNQNNMMMMQQSTTSSTSNNNNNNNKNSYHHHDEDEHKPKQWVQKTLSFGISNEPLLKKEIAEKESRIEQLSSKCDMLERELNRLRRTQEEFQHNTGDQAVRMARYQESMLEVMKESARTHRREARRAHHNKQFELGHQTVMSTPVGQREVWVHGNRMRELHSKLDMVSARIGYVENLKSNAEKSKKTQVKQQQQQKRKDTNSTNPDAAVDDEDSNQGGNNNNTNTQSLFPQDSALFDFEEEIEMHKAELATLRQLETQLRSELEDAFAAEKVSFLKEKARLQYEDQSEFASVPAIGNGRYVLMYLLGKGGFSEVWRAFDLREGRHVACKIHRIRREWSTAARETYMRHARRELDIQRSLDHPRLTKLYDVFEYNPKENNTNYNSNNDNYNAGALQSNQINGENIFVSVMEYSAGDDLDSHLRKFRMMREVDARIVFMQIVSCLRHLAEQKEPIIHYDLKPANILFHSALSTCMDIKITDFGLSKIIAEGAAGDDNKIDMTSPGAGTYWYLPPESFSESTTSKISPKVDIWSAGVIFYQMLYGKRPFADGESQRKIWQEQLIVRNANRLEFPEKPVVSEGAKNLIRRCLTPCEDDRPDIILLSNDPYLRQPSRRKRTTSSTTATSASDVVNNNNGLVLNGPRTPAQPQGGAAAPLHKAGGMEFKVPAAP